MNYTKSTKKPQKLTEKFSPAFIEFIDDTYAYFSKYSGKKFAESLGIDRRILDSRKRTRRKHA